MKKYLSILVSGCLCASLLAPVAAASDYSDTQGHWAEESITVVSQFGLFQGDGDSFMPDETMTRAMFVTVLGRLVESQGEDIAVDDATIFDDVVEGSWYADYVAWASANEIVNGKGDGVFAPDDQVTREQMCAILVRFLTWTGMDLSEYTENTVEFLDGDSISEYALEAVSIAQQMGLVQGESTDDGMVFNPQQAATRSAVATVFVRSMDQMGIDVTIVETEEEVEEETSASTSGGGGGGGGDTSLDDDDTDAEDDADTDDEVVYSEEEIAEEAEIAGYLETMVDFYNSTPSSDLASYDAVVQETLDLLMSCIEGAMNDRDDGVFLTRAYIDEEYGDTIADMKVLYSNLTDAEYTQFTTVIASLERTENIYAVMDFFGVSV